MTKPRPSALGLLLAGKEHVPGVHAHPSLGVVLSLKRTSDWGCTAGGQENMLRNWVAPHEIRTEDPKAGTTWADIDFGAAALANGYGGSEIFTASTMPPCAPR